MRWSSLVLRLVLVACLLQPIQAYKRRHRQTYQDIDSDGAHDIQITIYPTEAQVREGRDISFDCRARTSDNSFYPSTKWTRVGGPLPSSAYESGGRLTFNPVSLSDAGSYVCVATHDGQSVEATATLNVLSYGPQELQGTQQTSGGQCQADEKACGNNECVKNDYVCDGEPDCRDRSDEANCPALRVCEPNEFKCNNQRCVQKMWLCDGDDDCGDNSDELNCGEKKHGETCKPTEFKCHSGNQCVPSSFHCDGTNDCHDGSDEVGCVQPTVVEPPQTNLQVPQGSSFTLTCKSVAVPEPYINWRLNWGPTCEPPRCLQTSEGGYGTLTVNNAQPIDQGAYTCEAINVKGRVLATPDCIVRIVDLPAPTRPPPPAPPIRQPSCSGQGAASPYPNHYGQCECKPLVTGPNCDQCRPGSFHLSEKSPQGCLKCFCFGVTDQCRSSGFYRTKDRLMFAGDAEGVTLSDVEERNIERDTPFDFFKTGYITFSGTTDGVAKYWRLPQRFLGDKVTSYGGKMEFEIEFSGHGAHSSSPMVVLKGNQNILVHKIRNQEAVLRSDSPVRITVETYENNYEQLNGQPATREDLLMVLADLDAFLIRATHVDGQTSTSLGDVSWEIAVDRHTPDGLALEVEQCTCPPGYVGTSCEDCAPGYERSGHGPYLGTCVPIQARPQTCGPGAVAPTSSHGQCRCKNSVVGPNCDQCAPNSFGLAPTNPQGCIPCFCSGVTQQCSASNYRRTTVDIDYRRGDRDQLSLSTSDSRHPFSPQAVAQLSGSSIDFQEFHEANGKTLYWKLPQKFLDNKVTAYGGTLKYTFKYSGSGRQNQDPHVILRGNDISLQYTHREQLPADRENTIEIKILEDKFQRVDGQPVTREHLLMTLADLDTFLVKATQLDDCSQSSLVSVSIEYAEPFGQGLSAAEVEQCVCPPGYVGTSCEDCAPGYSRTGGGLYLGLCEKCECHGHASQCDKEYGYCLDCQHNTEGDQCERCKPGFVGDARRGSPNDCQPVATRPPCQCNNHSPRGCDSFGRCLLCEHNTEGTQCERCKKGYYGVATKGTPYDCTPCPCPGTSDCFLDNQGQVSCRNCPAGLSGRLCNECAPGYTRSNKEAGRPCEPIGSVTADDRTYVPSPDQGGRPPSPVVDPPHLTVNEGDAAAFRCWVPGIPDCQITWHRDRIGGQLPHGVYQTGNALKIPQSQMHHAGRYICSAVNQYGIGQSPPAVLEVVRPSSPPKVDPVRQTVDRDTPARFRCWVPNSPQAQLKWARADGSPLPSGAQEQQGILHIPRTTDQEVGQYVCTATTPEDSTPQRSEPVSLEIREPQQPTSAPQVDPPRQTVNVNDPAQFRCWVPGQPDAQIKWSRANGRPFPQGTLERGGFLRIEKSQLDDAGDYVCTATDPHGRNPQNAPPAVLTVNQPAINIQVDPPIQTVEEGEPSRIRCWVPGQPDLQLRWSKRGRRPLPQGAQEQSGHLTIPRTQKADEDDYICTATDPSNNRPIESTPARINVKTALKPVVDPAEQTIPVGQPFRIRCHVPGHPHIELTWRKVNGQLSEDSDQDDGILSVGDAVQSDQGDYICSARDPTTGQPVDSEPATVHVTAPSVVPLQSSTTGPVITPPEQTVQAGQPATITCTVDGRPNQRLTIFRADHQPLPFGSASVDGLLRIPSAEVADAGSYVCVYRPANGQAPKQTGPSVLHVESPAQPPKPVASPPLQTVKPGETVRFNCVVESGGPATIKWGFGSAEGALPEGAVVEGDDVVVDEAAAEHVGNYVCSASNQNGEGVAEPVRLAVTDDEEPPTARVEPRTWNGKPGDRHQFKCIVTGSPTPKITWTGPNGTPLPHDVTALEPNLLDFSNGRSELNGDYTCTATNPVGEASDHGTVNIGPQLNIKVTPAGPRLILTVGEPLEVKCEAFGAPGDPEPTVEWLHDQGPERGDLPEDLKPVIMSEQFIRHPSIGLGNAGAYTCKGSSPHATATKNIYIEVVEPSKIATVSIVGGSIQKFDQGEPGELICTATGNNLVDRLEWVKIEDQLPNDVEEHNEPGVLHFPNFKNSFAGEYECRGYRNNQLIASSIVRVISADEDIEEPIVNVDPPKVRVVNQGDNIALKCSVEGNTNGATYNWALLADGNIVRQLGKEQSLEIRGANPSKDSGIYRCNVEDDNGLVVGSAYTAVSVGFADKNNAQVVKFDEKSDAVFSCPIYALPGSKVEWSYENGELPSHAVPNGNKLEIKNFDDTATGVYVCKVTYQDNVIDGYVDAQIFVPDTIIQVLLEVSTESPEVGQSAWLDCKVTGDTNAVISWTKEGSDELPANAQVIGGRLLFTDVSEDNAGVYRCIAKTTAGPLQTRTVLNVGNSKRMRKHLPAARRRLRHRRRNANRQLRAVKAPKTAAAKKVLRNNKKNNQKHGKSSMFGSWFSTD